MYTIQSNNITCFNSSQTPIFPVMFIVWCTKFHMLYKSFSDLDIQTQDPIFLHLSHLIYLLQSVHVSYCFRALKPFLVIWICKISDDVNKFLNNLRKLRLYFSMLSSKCIMLNVICEPIRSLFVRAFSSVGHTFPFWVLLAMQSMEA